MEGWNVSTMAGNLKAVVHALKFHRCHVFQPQCQSHSQFHRESIISNAELVSDTSMLAIVQYELCLILCPSDWV